MDDKVYVLVTAQRTNGGDVNIFISGVFQNEEDAQDNLCLAKALENEQGKHYQVIPYTINRLYLEKDLFNSTLEDMIRDGEIDYAIAEDGKFVYTVLDKDIQ